MRLDHGKLNITIDGQFGSTGKGVLNAYLGKHNDVNLAISNAAPNAGHTFDVGQGKKVAFHLPISGILNYNSLIYLCAGAIIEPEVLYQEMETFDCQGRVYIHPRAMVLLPHHGKIEKMEGSGTEKLASTQKGVGAALADKIMRRDGVVLAKDFFPAEMVKDINVHDHLLRQEMVLMEVPQGYGLSVNHGFSYPHCTSRDITIGSALNDAGVHPSLLGKVVASLRTYPIRVGNIVDENGNEIGNSGPFWPDSDERDWKEFGLEPEYTTVTKRMRRIATFSFMQYQDMLNKLKPDAVFLNFVNYFDKEWQLKELTTRMNIAEIKQDMMPYMLYGVGPKVTDVHDKLSDVVSLLWPEEKTDAA